MIDYQIVIPSLGRAHLMPKVLSLFPDAIVTVNESDIEPYEKYVPPDQLLPHPDLRLTETRNWILDNFPNDCIITVNDDTDHVQRLVGKTKSIRDPNQIRAIIENSVMIANDIKAGVFCWSITPNPVFTRSHVKPFRVAGPASAHAIGFIGSGRERRFDNTMRYREDYLFCMDTLRDDRYLFYDQRYSFQCGGMSRGKGGQTGDIAKEEFEYSENRLKQMYGKCIGGSHGNNLVRSFNPSVNRQNPMALK